MFRRIQSFMQEDRQYFSACKDSITARNGRMLRNGCIIYAFVLCFYTVLTVVTKQPRLLRIMYYVFDALHLALCLAVLTSSKLKVGDHRTTQICCACLELSILSFFALEGVFPYRTQHSLYIPIAILLVLLLFIHKAAYAHTITNLYVFSFAMLSYLYKTPEAYTNDIYIATATLISANIGYLLIAQMRHSEGRALTRFEKLSRTDQLTGIYNKASILEMCKLVLADTERACAFIIMDLDDFKSINDRYGHDVGDEVLKAVSRELQSCFRETDLIGRFGGDEFIVLMDNCKDIETIKRRMEKLLISIHELTFSVEELKVRCSMGITLKQEDDTLQAIFKRADTALYQAKSDGKGYFRIMV